VTTGDRIYLFLDISEECSIIETGFMVANDKSIRVVHDRIDRALQKLCRGEHILILAQMTK
jgi:hypothetical protein